MSEQSQNDESLTIIAALVTGDRWLSADSAAAHIGQMPRKSYLALASRAGFPVATWLGKRRVWRKSELDEWIEAERKRQQRQRAA